MRRRAQRVLGILACAAAGCGGAAGSAQHDAADVGDGGVDASDGGLARWELLAPMPEGPRQEHGVAVVGGIVYVVGAYGGGVPGQRLEAYDPATNTWATRAMLPFQGSHPNVAAAANRLYVLGAVGIGQTAEYNPTTNSWTLKRAMPSPRGAAATAAIGTKIYVAGGLGTDVIVRGFAAYDVVADTWEVLEPLPGVERDHVAGVALDGIFYVIGGRMGSSPAVGVQDRVDAYDPVARQWTAKAPLPRGRGGLAAGVVGGIIIVMGGEGNDRAINPNGVFPDNDAYDPRTNTWRSLPGMLTPRHGMGIAEVGGKLYVPGGATAEGAGSAVAILEAFTL